MWAGLGADAVLRCSATHLLVAATEWGEPGRSVGQEGYFIMTLLLWEGDNLGAAAAAESAAGHAIISVLRMLRCLSSGCWLSHC